MTKDKILLGLLALSFTAQVNAITVTNSPAINPGSILTRTSYTEAATPPADPRAFVANTNNVCGSAGTETRDTCYVRYTVVPTNGPAGTSQYTLINPDLACPAGYFIISSFDNRVRDPNNPNDTIIYQNPITLYPTPMSEYNTGLYSCSVASGSPDIANWSSCIEGGCGSFPARIELNGNIAEKTYSGTWRQDTYNGGANKCQHYSLSGCPSWCSRWTWENAIYKYLTCTREAGFYKIPNAQPDPLYTPSTIICGKPKIVWKDR
jgi:hypothetical protein